MSEKPYDEGEHCKEDYAHFGLAYYMASVFESGLANAILQLDYLAKVAEDFRLEGRENFDRSSYEAGFDIFLAKQHAQSLGNLIRRVQSLAEMDADLKAQVVQAKKCRDFLAAIMQRFELFWPPATIFDRYFPASIFSRRTSSSPALSQRLRAVMFAG